MNPNVDDLNQLEIKPYLGDNSVELPTMAHAKVGEILCLLAIDEYSVLIVPEEEVRKEVIRLKEKQNNSEGLINSNGNRELNALYNSILMTTVVNVRGRINVYQIASLFTDNDLCFRKCGDKLKMYLGKEAFRKGYINEFRSDFTK